jgi:hypothetical protein
MAQPNNQQATDLFQDSYGSLNNLLPEAQAFCEVVKYTESEKVGDNFIEGLVLTAEVGITFGGKEIEAFAINPAIAGVVKQISMQAYSTVLPSVIPWNAISRSVDAGKTAFVKATAHVVDNNMASHYRFIEAAALYGQSDALLGYVSYATATYRTVSFTNGGGALTVNGSSVTFTAGVNTTSKWILLAPGEFAAGLWVGMEGVVVNQVDSTGAIVGTGKLVAVDAEMGAVQVDFTPTAASSTTSHRLCYDGWESQKEMPGAFKIMQNTGSLFGVSAATYSLYKGTTHALGSVLPTFARFNEGVVKAVNRGGLGGKSRKDGNLTVICNPRTWQKLLNEQASLRSYDKSYSSAEFVQGAESIVYYTAAGKAEFIASAYMKEGYMLALHVKDWVRSGSTQIQMGVPGIDTKFLFVLQNNAGMAFRTFSDQYVFCRAPAKSILFTGINDENAS